MKHKFLALTFFSFIAINLLQAQYVSVDEAVSMALQKNYDVKLFRNTSAAANNDNRFAFGAFLPFVNATGTYLRITNNSRNVNFLDVEKVVPTAKSVNTNAGVQLAWTLFDGTKMFATRKRVTELAELGELNVRNQMMNTAANVTITYYNIVRQKQQLKAILEQMSVSEERVKLAEKKLQVGTGGKPELLQAKVDLNAFRTAKLQQETLIQQLKDQLSGLLGMGLPDVFEISDSIPIDNTLTLDQISADIENTNQLLVAQKKNIEIFGQIVKENRASRSPVVSFISNYNIINKTENQIEVIPNVTQKLTQNQGYNYGATISIPIMNGMNVNRLISLSKINLERQRIIYDQQLTIALVGVKNAFVNYDNTKRILLIEEENILLAKENVMIALEGFKRGITTYIELRTAQQSLTDAYNRLIAARYNAKTSEIELLRLKGGLLN